MKINYINGDATIPQAEGNKIICHICNDIGGWGRGFVVAISKRWKEPEKNFREWYSDRSHNDFALGAVQLVQVEDDLYVANLIGQHKLKSTSDGPPIRYEAVETGLKTIAQKAKELNASIHMPRIGCGLAGGKWENIEPMLINHFIEKAISVTVYDFG